MIGTDSNGRKRSRLKIKELFSLFELVLLPTHTMAKRRGWVFLTFLPLCPDQRALKAWYRKREENDRRKKGSVRWGRGAEQKRIKVSGD